MLLRIRWFLVGVFSSLGIAAYLTNRIRRARERFSARNLARAGMRGAADVLDSTARRIDPARRAAR
jgi:hypothetical protein